MSINVLSSVKRVLVTGVGGPTPRSFVRSIKYFGGVHKDLFEFIGIDSNPRAYGLYDKSLFTKTFLVPRAEEDLYWSRINEIIMENNIDAAIVLPESEVLEWAKNHSRLTKKIKLHLPDYRLAEVLVNKFKLHNLLKDTDYIPHYMKLDPKNFSYDSLVRLLGNKFWVRGTEGSSGMGSLKIDSEKKLHQWIEMNPEIDEFLATEYLSGRNLACKLLYFNNVLLASACAERVKYIMAKVAPSGITGNTAFGRLLNDARLVEIGTTALSLVSREKDVGLNGIYTIDFKEDRNGIPKITEVNIRHVAFTSSFAAAGANLPLLTLLKLFDETDRTEETIHYIFSENYVFLRDVDAMPVLLKESELF